MHDVLVPMGVRVAQRLAPRLDASTIERVVEDPCTAVVHIRCGMDTLRAPDYGLVPHRFVLENLPKHIKQVLFVGRPYALGKGTDGESPNANYGTTASNLCGELCARVVW